MISELEIVVEQLRLTLNTIDNVAVASGEEILALPGEFSHRVATIMAFAYTNASRELLEVNAMIDFLKYPTNEAAIQDELNLKISTLISDVSTSNTHLLYSVIDKAEMAKSFVALSNEWRKRMEDYKKNLEANNTAIRSFGIKTSEDE
jgi:hypothetical protein